MTKTHNGKIAFCGNERDVEAQQKLEAALFP